MYKLSFSVCWLLKQHSTIWSAVYQRIKQCTWHFLQKGHTCQLGNNILVSKRELSQLLEHRLARLAIAVLVLIRSVVFQACDKPLALLDLVILLVLALLPRSDAIPGFTNQVTIIYSTIIGTKGENMQNIMWPELQMAYTTIVLKLRRIIYSVFCA